MKKVLTVLFLLPVLAVLSGCTRIGAGHVGVEINLAGSQRGASEIPVRTGWVFYNPLTTTIVEYPTFVQTAVWTNSEHEGKDGTGEITFNSKEGMTLRADVSLSYQLEPLKVPDFYVKFRSDDLENFTHGFLHNVARDQFNEVASDYTAEDIYGPKKEQFLATVRARVEAQMSTFGLHIQQFGFIGAPRVPENYLAAMNSKVTATQSAQQAENELRRTQAEAAKVVAAADGEAKAAISRAKGEAEANRLRNASITPNILELRRLENQHDLIWKWDGKRPQIEGDGKLGNFLMQVPN